MQGRYNTIVNSELSISEKMCHAPSSYIAYIIERNLA
jgi:hypothetical protein